VSAQGTRRNDPLLAWLLAGLATIGPFSIDTYLPSFPSIGREFAADPLVVQQTLSLYLASFGVMTLFHGALSDTFGRRPVILACIAVFALASAGCALAPSIEMLLACRMVQGMSAGAGMVVGRAIIRDTFDGAQAQRLMSQVTMIFSLAPAIAPIVGGLLDSTTGWRGIFVFLVLFAVLLGAGCAVRLPETLPPADRQPFRLGTLARGYARVFGHPRFAMIVLAVALNFAGFFIYVVSAPAVVYDHLGLGATEFAWLFVPGITGVLVGAWTSGRLAGRVSPQRTVSIGYAVMAAAAAAAVVFHALLPPALPWTVLFMAAYAAGMSLAMPSLTLLALDLFPRHRGTAASVQGFTQSMSNTLLAGVVSPLVAGSQWWLSLTAAACLLLGFGCWQLSLRLGSSRRG
jgi:DHA1 family bicyclomycin/chloramphenicol resistance-like MFS transporter